MSKSISIQSNWIIRPEPLSISVWSQESSFDFPSLRWSIEWDIWSSGDKYTC